MAWHGMAWCTARKPCVDARALLDGDSARRTAMHVPHRPHVPYRLPRAVPHPQDDVTALHLAASSGHLKCCSLLIRHGADVNAVSKSGSTPLLAALVKTHHDVAQLLLLQRNLTAECVNEMEYVAAHKVWEYGCGQVWMGGVDRSTSRPKCGGGGVRAGKGCGWGGAMVWHDGWVA